MNNDTRTGRIPPADTANTPERGGDGRCSRRSTIYSPDMPTDDAVRCLWWDRYYGPDLQKAKTQSARERIVAEAAAEYRRLTAHKYTG